MTTYSIRARMGRRRSANAALRLKQPWLWLLAPIVVGWTAFAAKATMAGTSLSGSSHASLALIIGLPGLLGAAAVFGRRPLPDGARLAAGWTATVAGALIMAQLVASKPIVAVAVPAIALSTVFCRRYAATAVTALLFVSGSFGSLIAFLSYPLNATVDLIVAGIWLGAMLDAILRARKERLLIIPGVVLMVAYLALTALAIPFGRGVSSGVHAFLTGPWYIIGGLAVAYAGWPHVTYERIARGVVVVAALVGGYATLRLMIGPSNVERAYALRAAGGYDLLNGKTFRLVGSFASVHQLASWTAAIVPFCIAYAMTAYGRWRAMAVFAATVCGVGLVGSGVRAGLVGVGAGAVLVLLLYQLAHGLRGGPRVGTTLATIVAVLGVAVAIFATTNSTQRYSGILHPSQDPAYVQRLYKWSAAVRVADSHPLGQGLGTARGTVANNPYTSTANLGYGVDNSYLVIALEQGWAITGVFVSAVLALMWGLTRRALTTGGTGRSGIAIGAAGALLSLLVMSYGAGYLFDTPAIAPWLLVGLGLGQFTHTEAKRTEAAIR